MRKALLLSMCLILFTSLFLPFSVQADDYDKDYASNCVYQNESGVYLYVKGVDQNVLVLGMDSQDNEREVAMHTVKNADLLKGSCPVYASNVNGNWEFSNDKLPYPRGVYTRVDRLEQEIKKQECTYTIGSDNFVVKLDDENATVLLYKNGKNVRNPFPNSGNSMILSPSEIKDSLLGGTCPSALVFKSGDKMSFSWGAVIANVAWLQSVINILKGETYFLTNDTSWGANGTGDNKAPDTSKPSKPGDIVTGDCTDILDDDLVDFLQEIFNYIKFIAPILVILLGSLDFGKAVIAGDDKELKNATNRFIKRLIAAVALFFLPILLNVILSMINKTDGTCGITYIWR